MACLAEPIEPPPIEQALPELGVLEAPSTTSPARRSAPGTSSSEAVAAAREATERQVVRVAQRIREWAQDGGEPVDVELALAEARSTHALVAPHLSLAQYREAIRMALGPEPTR
jgi:hypothetical protein